MADFHIDTNKGDRKLWKKLTLCKIMEWQWGGDFKKLLQDAITGCNNGAFCCNNSLDAKNRIIWGSMISISRLAED